MARVFLLRHAKAVVADKRSADHERALAPRGRRASRALAQHFREAGIAPDLVLCSSAARTRETLDLVLPGFARPPIVAVERGLYLASAGSILQRLRGIERDVGAAMVIGHNPGLHELAIALAATSEESLRTMILGKFPTGALASFEIAGKWARLAPGTARLTGLLVPADLAVS